MEKRLQVVNGDTVLEIIESETVKRRLSENTLLLRRERLTQSIARFEDALNDVDEALGLIAAEKHAAKNRK